MTFDTFANVLRCPVYTTPHFCEHTLKSVLVVSKVLPLNLFECDNILDLFFKLLPNWFWQTQGLLLNTEIDNHMCKTFRFHY